MITPVFRCHVRENGRVDIPDAFEQQRYRKWKAGLKGEDVELILRKRKSQRTSAQNRYMHAVPFLIIGNHCGCSLAQIKSELLRECFGTEDVTGVQVAIETSTSALDVEKGTYFIEWMVQWAAEFFDPPLHVPLPNDCEWEGA